MKKLILAGLVFTTSNLMAAWTAEVVGARKSSINPIMVEIDLSFTDGSQVVPFTWVTPSASTATIAAFCRDQIARYDAVDAFLAAVPVGPVDIVKQVTPQEKAKIQFFKDYNRLASLKRLVADGGLEANDQELLALQDVVKATFKQEYFDNP